LVHDSVVKTRALNTFFLRIVSFLGGYNPRFFWASHTEHHKCTLHPPDDLEVVLPISFTLRDIVLRCLFSPAQLWVILSTNIRHAFGRLKGPWENALFPESDLIERRRMFNWARIHVAGHAVIATVLLTLGWWLHEYRLWLVPVLITLTPGYRGWLHFLCNQAQHTGLQDNANDFRLCCRTMILNPFFRFLYWHMNYHTEHHMYAAVPCYNLGKLHKIIKADLPECPRGLFATWKQIIAIIRKQRTDPGYQFIPTLPASRSLSPEPGI
jgi:fatty acid desaturase